MEFYWEQIGYFFSFVKMQANLEVEVTMTTDDFIFEISSEIIYEAVDIVEQLIT